MYLPPVAATINAKWGIHLAAESGLDEVPDTVAKLVRVKPLNEQDLLAIVREHENLPESEYSKYLWGGSAGYAWAKKTLENISEESSEDYLVVEDPDKKSTWHLPVKKNGQPDHRLMGAAWAALHGGYRGNKYDGPNRAEAIKKLRSLYKSEKMDTPEESFQEAENYGGVPFGATSFADIEAYEKLDERVQEIYVNTNKFQRLVDNIIYSAEVVDKPGAIRAVSEEFISRLEAALMEPSANEMYFSEEAEVLDVTPLMTSEEIENIQEEDVSPNRGLVTVDFVLLEPGWGNTRDNFFYPKEMLQRDAGKFVGSKMYETNHKQSEKSTRTWVSTITECPVGITETGAPIARAVIHSPDFANRVLNLHEAGLLSKMENSVMAKAIGKPYSDGTRTGKIIKEFVSENGDPAGDVDWVTRAGAGGRILKVSESAAEPEVKKEEEIVEEVAENLEVVTVQESDEKETSGETTVEEVSAGTEAVVDDTPKYLEVGEVAAILEKSKLPEAAREELLKRQFSDVEQVKENIEDMRSFIKKLTGSKVVFGMGEVERVSESKEKPAFTEEAQRNILKKYGMGNYGR